MSGVEHTVENGLPNVETLSQRKARWRADERAARRTKGHVFAICRNCGEAWMVADAPECCRRCDSADVVATKPCPGCSECIIPPACDHEWTERGSGPEDRWHECWLCGTTRHIPPGGQS